MSVSQDFTKMDNTGKPTLSIPATDSEWKKARSLKRQQGSPEAIEKKKNPTWLDAPIPLGNRYPELQDMATDEPVYSTWHKVDSKDNTQYFKDSILNFKISRKRKLEGLDALALMQEGESSPRKKRLLDYIPGMAKAPGVSAAQIIDTLLAELLDLKPEDIGFNLNEIIFQGFQPRDFLLAMSAKARASGITGEQHKRNMVLLGLICAVRGSKINKIINSNGTSASMKKKLTDLARMYEIREGRPEGPITATLPRFLAVTAIPVSKIINQDAGELIKLPISPEEVAPGFPLVFCMSHSGGLLPHGPEISPSWHKAVAYGQYLMSLKFGTTPSKLQVLQFVQIASKSNLWTNEQKLAHLTALGLMEGSHFIEEVHEAIEDAAAKFDFLRA